jgi:DNA replication protein DnaC
MADPNCSICNGTGFKIVERGGLSGAAPCTCGTASRARDLRENSNIPPKYEDASLESFRLPKDNPTASTGLGTALLQVRTFVREYPLGDHRGLLLMGDPGAGKTHLAIGVMKALLEKGHECVFYDYQTLIERIRAGWDVGSGVADREAYRRALEAEVLVLDDLGAHRVVEWVQDTIESIITHRYNNGMSLIATTNLPDPDVTGNVQDPKTSGHMIIHKKTLAEWIGMRARSRLFEMCRVIRMPAVQDFRVQHGKVVKI